MFRNVANWTNKERLLIDRTKLFGLQNLNRNQDAQILVILVFMH